MKFAGHINLVPLPLQVYHLASVRLRDLCVKLDISSDLRGKIWTCFEHSLVHCTDLMKDRHLDQLLLCSIYIISKVRTWRKASHLIKKNVWQLFFLNRLRLLRWLAGKCLSGILALFCRKTRLSQPEKSRQFIHNILSFSCLSCQYSFSDGEYI